MTRYVALLRGVNVGGNNKLPMTELKAMCDRAGFTDARTFIASGNVVFSASTGEAEVKAALEAQIAAFAGKPIRVMVRTAAELAAVLAANPFSDKRPNRTVAIFLDEAPPASTLEDVTGRKDEDVRLGTREIYVHYGDGMADSRLRVPAAASGTARNINTITALAAMAATA